MGNPRPPCFPPRTPSPPRRSLTRAGAASRQVESGDTVQPDMVLVTVDTEQAGAKADSAPAPAPAAEEAAPKVEAAPAPKAEAAPAPAAAPAAPAAPATPAAARETRVPMTRLRKRVAERLKDSQNTLAMLTTFNEVDMTNLMALRASFKDEFLATHGVKLGIMSLFVKAATDALQKVPAVVSHARRPRARARRPRARACARAREASREVPARVR